MARIPQEKPEIQRLIQASAEARSRLEEDVATLRHSLDVPARVGASLRHHPTRWLGGSIAAGFATSFLLRRKSAKKRKQKKIPAKLLGLTLTAARPLLKVWFANYAKQWLSATVSRQLSHHFGDHLKQPNSAPPNHPFS